MKVLQNYFSGYEWLTVSQSCYVFLRHRDVTVVLLSYSEENLT